MSISKNTFQFAVNETVLQQMQQFTCGMFNLHFIMYLETLVFQQKKKLAIKSIIGAPNATININKIDSDINAPC